MFIHFLQYEVWASDQSNTIGGLTSPGVKGGYLWIWNSTQVDKQLAGDGDAVPMSCTPTDANGPCNYLDVFPQEIVDSASGLTLGDLPGFGRIHIILKDPTGNYVAGSFFAPGGGYVGIIDTRTKHAVALFRATGFTFAGQSETQRTVHMSTWTTDGSAILIDNLNGRAIERIDVIRNNQGGECVLSNTRMLL